VIVLRPTKAALSVDAENTFLQCIPQQRMLRSPLLRFTAVAYVVWFVSYLLRELLPYSLVWACNCAACAVMLARTLLMFNVTNRALFTALLRQFEPLWLSGNALICLGASVATAVSAGDRAYWTERGWPVDAQPAAYVASQVCLFVLIALVHFSHIRVDSIPVLSQRMRLLFIVLSLLVFAGIFAENVRGHADIQATLPISFFVFQTDSVQLRDTALLNFFILNVKHMVKTLRRPRETLLVYTGFQIAFREQTRTQTG
jgi:hypothetical protein